MTVNNQTGQEPQWTDAEHDEIMRLHIIDGLTISEAKWLLFEKRQEKVRDV